MQPFHKTASAGYNTLVLITDAFPFGGVPERTFIEPELSLLAERFGRVIIVPTVYMNPMPESLSLPAGVEVSRCWIDSPEYNHKIFRLRYLFYPSVWNLSVGHGFISNLKMTVMARSMAASLRRWLHKSGIDSGATLFYSFWLSAGAMSLGLLSRKMSVRYIVCAHRFDILSKISPRLRRLTVAHAMKMYGICSAGVDAITAEFGDTGTEIRKRTLGSVKIYPERVCVGHDIAERKLTFLSVARVEPVKRVAMNFEMIKAIAVARSATKVKWIHIGDGSELKHLREKIANDTLPENLEVHLAGGLSNADTQRTYTAECVDWFIHLSSSEGLPIAICEALSYGVPVIAADVGGVSEAVTDDTGILLPEDVRAEEFVRSLLPYLENDVRRRSIRVSALKYWQEKFDASHLRSEFVDELSML